MSFKGFCLILAMVYFVVSCSDAPRVPHLSQQERAAIDSLDIDSLLILEVRQLTGKEFMKMPGAVQAIERTRITPTIHGITLGFFEINKNFDESPLEKINEKWNSEGYVIQTFKSANTNRLEIRKP